MVFEKIANLLAEKLNVKHLKSKWKQNSAIWVSTLWTLWKC